MDITQRFFANLDRILTDYQISFDRDVTARIAFAFVFTVALMLPVAARLLLRRR